MDPRNLYTLRYRQGFGVQSVMIVASNPHLADAVGKKWCNSRINCRFIKIEPAVAADESLLTPAEIEAAVPKKKDREIAPAADAPTASDKRATAAAASIAGGVPTAGKKAS